MGVRDWTVQAWEYGRRGVTSERAAKLARQLGLPVWHFEQALLEDRQAAICLDSELTCVRIGLASWLATIAPPLGMSVEQWLEVRAHLVAHASGNGTSEDGTGN